MVPPIITTPIPIRLVDAAPKALKEGVKKEEAETMKTRLEGEGAKVTIK